MFQSSVLGGDVDAAFISIDEAFHPNVQITQSSEIAQLSSPYHEISSYYSSSELVEGMDTTKVGISSNITYGKLRSTSAFGDNSSNGLKFRNLFTATNTQMNGDSGAPVFTTFTGPLQWGEKSHDKLIGMACFKSDNNSMVYGAKADVIMQHLGVSLYTE